MHLSSNGYFNSFGAKILPSFFLVPGGRSGTRAFFVNELSRVADLDSFRIWTWGFGSDDL